MGWFTLVALCHCFLQSWILLTLFILLWYVLVFRASAVWVVVLYSFFPSGCVSSICGLPVLRFLLSRVVVLFCWILPVGVWCCFWGFPLLYYRCRSSVYCWCGTLLLFRKLFGRVDVSHYSVFSCRNSLLLPLCGFPSFVLNCCSTIFGGCVVSSELGTGFLWLRSLLRCSLVTVSVFLFLVLVWRFLLIALRCVFWC